MGQTTKSILGVTTALKRLSPPLKISKNLSHPENLPLLNYPVHLSSGGYESEGSARIYLKPSGYATVVRSRSSYKLIQTL